MAGPSFNAIRSNRIESDEAVHRPNGRRFGRRPFGRKDFRAAFGLSESERERGEREKERKKAMRSYQPFQIYEILP